MKISATGTLSIRFTKAIVEPNLAKAGRILKTKKDEEVTISEFITLAVVDSSDSDIEIDKSIESYELESIDEFGISVKIKFSSPASISSDVAEPDSLNV